jgi:hypothetical protein
MSRRGRRVLDATSGRRRVELEGAPLDPQEAFVAALLEQTEGTSLEVPARRLLLSSPAEGGSLRKVEASAAIAAATRSAIPLGRLDPGPPLHPDPPAGDDAPEAADVELAADAPPTRRVHASAPSALSTPPPLWALVLEGLLTPGRRAPPRVEGPRRRLPDPRLREPEPLPAPRDPLAATDALDRGGRRVEALAAARELAASIEDPRVHEKVAELDARLVGSHAVDLEWEGRPTRIVFAPSATLGRAGADIVIQHAGLSRRHIAIARAAGGPVVSDLGSLNGTRVAGERIVEPVPIGDGIDLELAEAIPCRVRPVGEHAVSVDIGGGLAMVVFQGAAELGPFRIRRCTEHDRAFLRLTSRDATLRLFASEVLAVDLCHGDALGDGRAVRLRLV